MSKPAAGPITYSPEQNAIFDATDGLYCVVANAGSGKTEVSAEKVSRSVKYEVEKKFKGRMPTAEELAGVLKQFLVVTFTRKASLELDDRVLKKLKKFGYPEPQEWGRAYRICMTLDSYLQRWVKNPAFFAQWMKNDPARESAFSQLLNSLSPQAKEIIAKRVAEAKGSPSPNLFLFYFWDTLIAEARQNALLDLLVRLEMNVTPLPGVSLPEIQAAFETFKSRLDPSGPTGWKASFLDEIAAKFTAWDESMRVIDLKVTNPKKHGLPSTEEVERHDQWRMLTGAREEFLSCHEIGRARQYDAETRPHGLGHRDVINVLAPARELKSLRQVHSIGKAYKRLKRYLGLMDFGDYLSTFMDVIRKAPFLLERDKEYPAMGLRRKYVSWDEKQDSTPMQFYLFEEMTKNIKAPHFAMIVGDPFQSLYEFRGANPYQFIRTIEDLRERKPEHLLSLTCSFRSAKRIVALGNTIIKRLSRNGALAKPSRTVFKEEGEIVVAPPFKTQTDEAHWIFDKISELRTKVGGSFMIIMRAGLSSHPISQLVRKDDMKDVQLMTVHAAKGLEADHVFVVGLMSTRFPDVRGNLDQEANCFYVACTRPRRTLVLSACMEEEFIDEQGNPQVKMVGPSVYFAMIPELKELAIAAGWKENFLAYGVSSHKQALAALAGIAKRATELENEAQGFFGREVEPPEVRSTHYLGAISPFENIPVRADLPSVEGAGGMLAPASDAELAKVKEKLRTSFFKGRSTPDGLSPRERAIALKTGWLVMHGGRTIFTDEFKKTLRAA